MVFGFFGGEKPAPPQAHVAPLGIKVDHRVSIDLLRYAIAGATLGMEAPRRLELLVVAHGRVDLGDGKVLHRLYDDGHAFLQIMADGDGEEGTIQDVSFFRPWDSLVPGDREEWSSWTGPHGKIGAHAYDADGILFERAWNREIERWVEPVRFTEDVRDRHGRRSEVRQTIMLYDRLLSDGLVETLILSEEQGVAPTMGEPTIQFYLGLPIGVADIRPI